jgi:hypothetical protein
MLDPGIYLPPSHFEAAFVAAAHTEEDNRKTLAAIANPGTEPSQFAPHFARENLPPRVQAIVGQAFRPAAGLPPGAPLGPNYRVLNGRFRSIEPPARIP